MRLNPANPDRENRYLLFNRNYISLLLIWFLFFVYSASHAQDNSSDEASFKEIGLEPSLPELIKFIEGKSERIENLIKQLDDEDWHKRENAQEILIGIGMPILPRLQTALKDRSPEVRMRVNLIVKEISSQRNWQYLQSAIRLMAKTRDKQIINPLITLIEHSSRDIAFSAAQALVPFNNEPPLIKLIEQYRKSASEAESKKDIYGTLQALEKILWLDPANQEVQKKIELLRRETLCIIYLIDESGSMTVDKKLESVKQGLQLCINKLPAGTSLNVIFFATQPYPYKDKIQPLTPAIKDDIQAFIKERSARGGTNYSDVLTETFRQVKEDKRSVAALFFITDGPPTVGEINDKNIIQAVINQSEGKISVFTLGLGPDANLPILNELSAKTKGTNSHLLSPTPEAIINEMEKINSRIIESLMGIKDK